MIIEEGHTLVCMLTILLLFQVVLSCGALQHFAALLTHSKEKIKKVKRYLTLMSWSPSIITLLHKIIKQLQY